MEAYILIALVLYFVPTIVAYSNGRRQAGAICAPNILLGWTGTGWVIAFVWACIKDAPEAKAEEAKKQVEQAKKQAEEARKRAEEARKRAGEARKRAEEEAREQEKRALEQIRAEAEAPGKNAFWRFLMWTVSSFAFLAIILFAAWLLGFDSVSHSPIPSSIYPRK